MLVHACVRALTPTNVQCFHEIDALLICCMMEEVGQMLIQYMYISSIMSSCSCCNLECLMNKFFYSLCNAEMSNCQMRHAFFIPENKSMDRMLIW